MVLHLASVEKEAKSNSEICYLKNDYYTVELHNQKAINLNGYLTTIHRIGE